MVLMARGSAKESTFGPRRTMSPCFRCSSMCVHSARSPRTSTYRHQSAGEELACFQDNQETNAHTVRRQSWAGILVQAIVEFVSDEVEDNAQDEYRRPVSQQKANHIGCEHVECARTTELLTPLTRAPTLSYTYTRTRRVPVLPGAIWSSIAYERQMSTTLGIC